MLRGGHCKGVQLETGQPIDNGATATEQKLLLGVAGPTWSWLGPQARSECRGLWHGGLG
jgi:hypothetical protein